MAGCCDHNQTLTSKTAQAGHQTTADGCCSATPANLSPLTPAVATAGDVQTQIHIRQMDCPTEEGLIRKKLGELPTVKQLEFNLLQRVLRVTHSPEALDSVLDAIGSLGFEPELPDAAEQRAVAATPNKPWWPLVLAGSSAVAAEITAWMAWPMLVPAALAIVAVLACGLTTYKKGWIALRNGSFNINALMSIAVTGALVLQQWPEAAMVMVLFTLAELIEAKSLDRARHAIAALLQLAPDKALVQQADGSWQEMDTKTVAVGQVVRVKPGERISLDGQIVCGCSSINQAPITGESLPVDKTVGDAVFAGSLNGPASFEYRVTAQASQTTLARIIHAVEQAQSAKAPTQCFVDQFARVYTPIVLVIALAVALSPLLLHSSWHDGIYNALVLLVIACPCALVISTPVTIVSGLAAAARQGILVKGGVYLEAGRKLIWLALDKTGTLTHGKPVQTEFELRGTLDADTCRRFAASLAGRSDHPVSQAIAKAADRDGIAREPVDGFEALLGRGVRGIIAGKTYSLGNHRLVQEMDCCSAELASRLDVLERQGKTVVMLLDDQQVLALFAVADTVKNSSREAIAALQQLGIKTLMLTGDNPHTAEAIAQQVGIDQARGNQLPDDKLKAIEAFATTGAVGMVGDGINDAPALARATIGFAMGAMGTDTAIETADVALMDDDLRKIPTFVRLSQATHAVLIQNIVLALTIKALFLVLTFIGFGSLWMAVFADVGASLLVIGNGLRLLRK